MGASLSRATTRAKPPHSTTTATTAITAASKKAASPLRYPSAVPPYPQKTVTLPTSDRPTLPPSSPPVSSASQGWHPDRVGGDTDEWANALRSVSSVISSGAWRDDGIDGLRVASHERAHKKAVAAAAAENDRMHVARGSEELSRKLPRRVYPQKQPPPSPAVPITPSSLLSSPPSSSFPCSHVTSALNTMDSDVYGGGKDVLSNRLRHGDVIEIFHLRRNDVSRWHVDALCERFDIQRHDMVDLLRFTRTYMGRDDPDGIMRAYYNPDAQNTIASFERD